MAQLTLAQGNYTISTDPNLLDRDAIYAAVGRMYWAQNRTRETMDRAIANSLCFGLYHKREQVGFTRVITDLATFAYLADVYVLEGHRGNGMGKFLIKAVTTHPDLVGLRRMLLVTRDAHGLYQQFGFTPLAAPERWMERFQAGGG